MVVLWGSYLLVGQHQTLNPGRACRNGCATVPGDGSNARACEQMVHDHVVLGGCRSAANGEGLSTSQPGRAETTAEEGALSSPARSYRAYGPTQIMRKLTYIFHLDVLPDFLLP